MTANRRIDAAAAGNAALWASAFVVFALVLSNAGRLGESQARAEMIASVGEYRLMTTDGGNEEVVLVLDNRNEDLLVYKVKDQTKLELFQKLEIDRVFTDGRRAAGGRK